MPRVPRTSVIEVPSRLRAASRDLLNPLAPPGRRLEGIREILGLVHDLSVPELHDTHGVGWPPLVGDGVFRDPEITASKNSPDVEACRLTGMVTSQGLQIASPEDSLARLGIITNGIVIVNIVFRVGIAGCRGVPVSIQCFTYLFFLPGLLRVLLSFHVYFPLGINPGTPVSTTALNLCRVLIPSLISFIASSGSLEISKFSLMRLGVLEVVRRAVPRCTAHASSTWPGVLLTLLAIEVIT